MGEFYWFVHTTWFLHTTCSYTLLGLYTPPGLPNGAKTQLSMHITVTNNKFES
jgi:hypothetical protein